jgi:hypothetical protein
MNATAWLVARRVVRGATMNLATRVIFENQPYLLVTEDGIERAFGPFTPGTEPSLAECHPETEVFDPELKRLLHGLKPVSPDLPNSSDTLAGTR